MMMDYLGAGAPLRKAASDMLAAARVLMSDARRSCETSERDTRKSLSELDEKRQQVSRALATVFPLYRLAGLNNPGPAAGAETECLPTVFFDEDRLPSAPSATLWIAIGASGGGGGGAAAVLVAGVIAPFGWIAAVLGGRWWPACSPAWLREEEPLRRPVNTRHWRGSGRSRQHRMFARPTAYAGMPPCRCD